MSSFGCLEPLGAGTQSLHIQSSVSRQTVIMQLSDNCQVEWLNVLRFVILFRSQ